MQTISLFEAKRYYKDIYITDFHDGTVLWRLLNWGNYKRYREIISALPQLLFDVEFEIFRECVIEHSYSEDLESIKAGIIVTVAQNILYFSGVSSTNDFEQSLNNARASLNSLEEQIPIYICQHFNYTPEELDNIPWPVVMKRLAQIEVITGNPFNIEKPKEFGVIDTKEFNKRYKAADDPVVNTSVGRNSGWDEIEHQRSIESMMGDPRKTRKK